MGLPKPLVRLRYLVMALTVAVGLGVQAPAEAGKTQKDNAATQSQTQQAVTPISQYGDQNSLAEKKDTQVHDTKSLKQAISSEGSRAKANQNNNGSTQVKKNSRLREDFRKKVAQTTLPSKIIEKAFEKVPSSFGLGSVNNKGDGWKWVSSKGKNLIRIDMPDPHAKFPHQKIMHVTIRSEDEYVGRDGKPTPSAETPAAHIPYSEWITWRYWNRP